MQINKIQGLQLIPINDRKIPIVKNWQHSTEDHDFSNALHRVQDLAAGRPIYPPRKPTPIATASADTQRNYGAQDLFFVTFRERGHKHCKKDKGVCEVVKCGEDEVVRRERVVSQKHEPQRNRPNSVKQNCNRKKHL